MYISVTRLNQRTSTNPMKWLAGNSDNGCYSSITGSAWNFRNVILPSIHADASHQLGIAGAAAVARGADGRVDSRE